MKKLLKFIVAALSAPIYIPFLIIAALITALIELSYRNSDWAYWYDFNFVRMTAWYRFK